MIKLSRLISLSLFVAVGLIGCASTQTTQEEAPAPAAQTQATTESTATPTPQQEEKQTTAEYVGTGDDSYEVMPGDHLWGISGKPSIYGDPYRWPLIYKANTDIIEDADLIHPGQVLTITRSNTPYEIDAAIEHARTRGAWSLGVVEESDRRYLAQ